MPELADELRKLELVQMAGDVAELDRLKAALNTIEVSPLSAESRADAIDQTLAATGAGETVFDGSTGDAPPMGQGVFAGRATSYRIQQLHGQGGLGNVWLAVDEELKREVALKEIRPDRMTHDGAVQAFLKEAQVTGQLEHPNIVPVYQLGESGDDGKPFYSMRLVRGQTLRQAIDAYHNDAERRDAIGLRRLLTALVSVCNAIGYAHSRGVIHRDLKSANVVLGEFGEVIVVDWGLAKLLGQPDPTEEGGADQTYAGVEVDDPMRTKTALGQFRGTPAYMSPEQAQGRTDLVGPRTDVYGLGAILFEILIGQPPHYGKDILALLNRIAHGRTPQAREVEPAVHRALDAICAKAKARKLEERYATATDLARDLEQWLADEPVTAFSEPLVTRLGRWARRHKALVVGTARCS
jgi:serine/threonine protein kinase